MSSEPKPKKKILLVEDDYDLRETLNFFINSCGYDAVLASGGFDAIEQFKKHQFDLVISDVNMPKGDGMSLLNLVTSSKKPIPFVLMTGLTSIFEVEQSNLKGVSHFLNKPFEMKEFKEVINNCLEDKTKVAEKPLEELIRIHIGGFLCSPGLISDVYMKKGATEFARISTGTEFSRESQIAKCKEEGIQSLYVVKSDYKRYLHLQAAFDKWPSQSEKKKALFKQLSQLAQEMDVCKQVDQEELALARMIVESTISILGDHEHVLKLFEELHKEGHDVLKKGMSISLYSVLLAIKLETHDLRSLFHLAAGGLLHDVGFIHLPENQKNKTLSRMSEQELIIHKGHPIRGAGRLREIKGFPEDVIKIVLQHHEEDGGQGYPQGLKRKEIHPLAGIVGVVELFHDYWEQHENAPQFAGEALQETFKSSFASYDLKVLRSLFLVFKEPITEKLLGDVKKSA